MHDALLTLGVLPADDAAAWSDFLALLIADRRALRFQAGGRRYCAAVERWPTAGAIFANATVEHGAAPAPPHDRARERDADTALYEVVRGWMDCIGPTSVAALAARLGVAAAPLAAALARLEADGVVLRGCFTTATEEFCERGLLARIHRRTLQRLRREIEPVAPAELMRFLLRWQHLDPDSALHGRAGVRTVIRQLQGIEVPAPAWENDLLPARVRNYDPADLEVLALSGEITWGRLAIALNGAGEAAGQRSAPNRAAPLAFALREDLADLLAPVVLPADWQQRLSAPARAVHDELRARGASFSSDLARALRRSAREIDAALWELVACGLVTGDGVAGLRALLAPRHARRRHGAGRTLPVGRWSLLRGAGGSERGEEERAEAAALRLLRRYGVLLRELCARERHLPPWRHLLRALRRLEARGSVRGGRFVCGFVGEQFALPEALEALRAQRRRAVSEGVVLVAAADPLNLVGILPPGPRVPSASGLTIAYRAGSPIAWGAPAEVRERCGGGAPLLPLAALR